jgi:hypothetical protein
MGQPIPEGWCKAVVKALESYDSRIINWTAPAFQRWHSDTFGAFKSDAYASLIDGLSIPGITGNETTPYPGQKAVYEFFFRYRPSNGGQPKTMYGKIALLEDGIKILILSAHNPQSTTL